jgi:hypothetical protein
MLTQLSTLKTRLAIADLDTQFDPLLQAFIRAVSAQFDRECNRTFARTVGFQQEFGAADTEIVAACYPIETVSGFELKTSESGGWVQVTAECLVRAQCVISLETPIGSWRQQARVTFTGGFVLPGTVPGAGQTALPADLEQAAVEQAAAWFQNRNALGLLRSWPSSGTFQHFLTLPLLPNVHEVLKAHTRWV